MTPLVSIIIPCYNTEKFISKALTSIQNQSYQNIEVIIIDDGSTDNSVIICENFIQTDKRFSIGAGVYCWCHIVGGAGLKAGH